MLNSLLARLLLLVVAALAPALGFAIATEIAARTARAHAAHDEALRLVSLASAEQQRIAEGARQTLTVLAGFAAQLQADPAACNRRLAELKQAFGRYDALRLVAADGLVICAADPDERGRNEAGRPYFGPALAGDKFAGDADVADGSRMSWVMALPWHDGAGQVAGLVVAGLSRTWLQAQIDRLPLPDGAAVSIVDRDGRVLVRRPDAAAYVGQRVPEAMMAYLRGTTITTAEAPGLDGVTRIFGTSPLDAEPIGLAISVGLDRDRVFSGLAAANRREAELIVVGGGLAALLLVLGAQRLIRQPVAKLLVAAARRQQGDGSARAGIVARGGEFAQLAAAFDAMADAQEQREQVLCDTLAAADAARTALADSETRLRLALCSAQVAVFELDFQRRCVWLDERAVPVRRSAIPADEWLPFSAAAVRQWLNSVHPEDATRRRKALRAVVDGSAAQLEIEYRFGSAAEGWQWLSDRGVVVARDAAGAAVRLVGVTRDVTAQRDAAAALERLVAERTAALREREAQLAQAQKMEAVGQLTGGVAHDFNNLLQAVTGNLDLIHRLAEARGDGRLVRLTVNALRAANRGARLTQQLLAFSRKQNLKPERIGLTQLITELGDLLSRAAGEVVELRTEAEAALWPAHADPAQFESAMLNLIINARDAMPDGGTLTLALANVILDEDQAAALDAAPGDYVRVDVRDTGSGIAPEHLPRLFEPFFTTKEVGKGSGLGLAMVHGFARQSGGAVAVASELGRGTTVTLFLPRDRGEAAVATPGLPTSGVAPGRLRVLLVEDDADVLDALQLGLVDAGHAVIPARDGQEALELLASGEAVDLLLSDVVLPGKLSGIALAGEARRQRPGLLVLLTSGYAADALLPEAGLRGYDVLTKPFTQADLLRRITGLARPTGQTRAA